LKDKGLYVSLIKPQFECGKSGLGKGGIVKSRVIMADAVKKVIDCAEANSLGCRGLIRSPIQGGDGNTEFLMYCVLGEPRIVNDAKVKEVVGL